MIQIGDFAKLFLDQVPMLDVRAPVEFAKGAFPRAINIPLLDDEERAQVGIRYQQAGNDKAVELGHQLIWGERKARRLQQWTDFVSAHPQGCLYCFRGGLRSRTTQQWMRDNGDEYPLIEGGYKAMRRFLINELEASIDRAKLVLVAGKTGTGKTRVIEGLPRVVDLEGLARHRGSSFGRLPEPQPTQIDFENALSIAFMKLLNDGDNHVILEDEGKLIGRTALPDHLRDKMQLAPLLLVEESVAERVQVILEDYVQDLGERYSQAHAEQGPSLHRQHLLEGLARIKKRLGGRLFAELETQMQAAFEQQSRDGNDSLHRQWIEGLLVEYYDPMYEYQMSRREGDIIARGRRDEIITLARERHGAAQ